MDWGKICIFLTVLNSAYGVNMNAVADGARVAYHTFKPVAEEAIRNAPANSTVAFVGKRAIAALDVTKEVAHAALLATGEAVGSAFNKLTMSILAVGACSLPKVDAKTLSVLVKFCLTRKYRVGNETKCYGDLGCFEVGSPWLTATRPFPSPWPPEKVKTTIWMANRETPQPVQIQLHPDIQLPRKNWHPESLFIVHDFADSRNSHWMAEIKDLYMKKVNADVFLVDWSPGARDVNYFVSSSNARIAGAELGRFIAHLMKAKKVKSKIHLIGHGLGAHICGYAGKFVKKHQLTINRITALDPSRSGFEKEKEITRLSHNDADFVIVIHTDVPVKGHGAICPVGHVDFYANNELHDQPGCSHQNKPKMESVFDLYDYPVEDLKKWGCSHDRAIAIFKSHLAGYCKIKARKFMENKLDKCLVRKVRNTLKEVKSKIRKIRECSHANCQPLGLGTKKPKTPSSYYFQTGDKEPFCASLPKYDEKKKSSNDTTALEAAGGAEGHAALAAAADAAGPAALAAAQGAEGPAALAAANGAAGPAALAAAQGAEGPAALAAANGAAGPAALAAAQGAEGPAALAAANGAAGPEAGN